MVAYTRFVFEQNFAQEKSLENVCVLPGKTSEASFGKVLAAARYVCGTSWCRAGLDIWSNLCASKAYFSRKMKEMTATEESYSLT